MLSKQLIPYTVLDFLAHLNTRLSYIHPEPHALLGPLIPTCQIFKFDISDLTARVRPGTSNFPSQNSQHESRIRLVLPLFIRLVPGSRLPSRCVSCRAVDVRRENLFSFFFFFFFFITRELLIRRVQPSFGRDAVARSYALPATSTRDNCDRQPSQWLRRPPKARQKQNLLPRRKQQRHLQISHLY